MAILDVAGGDEDMFASVLVFGGFSYVHFPFCFREVPAEWAGNSGKLGRNNGGRLG